MPRGKPLTKEQKDFLLEILPYTTAKDATKEFYKKYNIKLNSGTMTQIRFRNNIKMEYYDEKLNENQMKWLLNYLPYHDNIETIEQVKNKFGIELNESILRNMRHNYKVKRVYKTKIRDMEYRNKIRKPLYNEKTDNNGIDYVRIGSHKYQVKRRFIWEQYYGRKIPKGYEVIFLDNNKSNFDINNLAIVKKDMRMFALKKNIDLRSKEIVKATNAIFKLEKKIKEVKRNESFKLI